MNLPVLRYRQSPNFSTRKGSRIDLIVIHDCQGGYPGSIATFLGAGGAAGPVSAHYVLKEDGSEATRMVDDSQKAWHCKNFNSRSIGIEMAGFEEKGYLDSEWQSAANMTAYLCHRHGIPVTWSKDGLTPGITRHLDLGAAGGGHTDPTKDPKVWQAFLDKVKAAYDKGGYPVEWKPDVAVTTPRTSHGYGWKRDIPMLGKQGFSLRAPQGSLKSSYDLRPGSTECYDQLSTSSCVGNAVAAAFEYVRARAGFKPDFRPSRLFSYYLARMVSGTTGEDSGAQIHDAFTQAIKYGLPPEWDWTFDLAKLNAYPDAKAWTAGGWHRIVKEELPQSIDAFKTAFESDLPVVCGATLYEEFESEAAAATGIIPMPTGASRVVGGHAFALWGLDDATQTVLCRNSWGPKWGDGGYFHLPYEYVLSPDLTSDFQVVRQVLA